MMVQAIRVAKRLADKKIKMELDESAVEYLATKGFDPVYGARPVKRAVQRELETALAKAMLREEIGEDDIVLVSASPEEGLKLERHSAQSVANGSSKRATTSA